MDFSSLRQIVTGFDEAMRSAVLYDGPLERAYEPAGAQGVAIADLWATDAPPRLERPTENALASKASLLPPAGGTRVRLVRHEPHSVMPMHSSPTVDYVIVIAGELLLRVENHAGDLILHPGDSVIQCGARHEWENRTSTPCYTATVVVGAVIRASSQRDPESEMPIAFAR
jgi:quercetin dioxygenase-like cupin family protein